MKEETQFSIYKIKKDKFMSIKGMDTLSKTKQTQKIIDIMLAEIRQSIIDRGSSNQVDIDKDGFVGVLYQTRNIPDWKDMISSTVLGTMLSFDVENVNVSYILLYIVKDSIYAMTAGFGSHLIQNYIEKDWGLHLMPKILDDKDGVIREVKENNMYGNTVSVSKANRNTTNIIHEKQIKAIFKELSLEVDDDIAKMFGVSGESKKRKTSMLLKDSLNLRKAISLSKLKQLLQKIEKIEKKTDKFALGYFVSAKSLGYSNETLIEALIEDVLADTIDDYILEGDDYKKYMIDASKYSVLDDLGKSCYEADKPITFREIIDELSAGKKMSKNYARMILKKYKICAKNDSGEMILNPTRILDAMQGTVELSGTGDVCYLLQGEWYCLNPYYLSILDEDFKKRIDKSKQVISDVKIIVDLSSSKKTEDEYNESFYDNDKVIVGHKSLMDKFEVADLIFWDEDTLYLMCNKEKFDGKGSRDLTNQLYASAQYLQANINSTKGKKFLEKYYKKIQDKYIGKGYKLGVTKTDFVKAFSKHIVFVAGYMNGYSSKSKTNYGKFLDVETYKNIFDMGYDYCSVDISKL